MCIYIFSAIGLRNLSEVKYVLQATICLCVYMINYGDVRVPGQVFGRGHMFRCYGLHACRILTMCEMERRIYFKGLPADSRAAVCVFYILRFRTSIAETLRKA